MKRFFITIASALLLGLVVFTPAQALDLGIGGAQTAAGQAGYDAEGTTDKTLAENIGGIIRTVLTASGVLFTALIFYAGFLWMNARGDEGQTQKAKDIIETCVIGLVIAMASYGITNFVMRNVVSRATPTAPVEENQ